MLQEKERQRQARRETMQRFREFLLMSDAVTVTAGLGGEGSLRGCDECGYVVHGMGNM